MNYSICIIWRGEEAGRVSLLFREAVGLAGGGLEEFLVGLGGHVELEGAAGLEFLIGEVGAGEGLAVEAHGADVAVFVADLRGFDFKVVAAAHAHLHPGQVGRAEDVLPAARADRVEPHGAEYVPGTHLPAVVVAAETGNPGRGIGADAGAVHLVHDLAHPVLRLPRLCGPHV